MTTAAEDAKPVDLMQALKDSLDSAKFINALAAEIRRVDGSHTLGAGALAEALAPFVRALVAARDTDETTLRTRIAEQIEALRSPLHTDGWNDALAEIKSRVLAAQPEQPIRVRDARAVHDKLLRSGAVDAGDVERAVMEHERDAAVARAVRAERELAELRETIKDHRQLLHRLGAVLSNTDERSSINAILARELIGAALSGPLHSTDTA